MSQPTFRVVAHLPKEPPADLAGSAIKGQDLRIVVDGGPAEIVAVPLGAETHDLGSFPQGAQVHALHRYVGEGDVRLHHDASAVHVGSAHVHRSELPFRLEVVRPAPEHKQKPLGQAPPPNRPA